MAHQNNSRDQDILIRNDENESDPTVLADAESQNQGQSGMEDFVPLSRRNRILTKVDIDSIYVAHESLYCVAKVGTILFDHIYMHFFENMSNIYVPKGARK